MLRLERPGFRAAARAETGVEARRDGERVTPFVEALGDLVCVRDAVPLAVWLSAVEFLLELPGILGLRGVADMITDNGVHTRNVE